MYALCQRNHTRPHGVWQFTGARAGATAQWGIQMTSEFDRTWQMQDRIADVLGALSFIVTYVCLAVLILV